MRFINAYYLERFLKELDEELYTIIDFQKGESVVVENQEGNRVLSIDRNDCSALIFEQYGLSKKDLIATTVAINHLGTVLFNYMEG